MNKCLSEDHFGSMFHLKLSSALFTIIQTLYSNIGLNKMKIKII